MYLKIRMFTLGGKAMEFKGSEVRRRWHVLAVMISPLWMSPFCKDEEEKEY